MGAIFVILLVLIIGYNLIVNLTNITIIVKYCLAKNSLMEYWELYFKNCFSFRAIYSSIFGLFLAIFIFFVLIPIVLIRKFVFKKQVVEMVSNGLIFEYRDAELPSGTSFYSNCTDYGFLVNKVEATGKISQDAENVLHTILSFGKQNEIEINYDFMKEMYIFSQDKTAIAPILLTKEEVNYPVYFIYDDKQITQFKNVKQALSETRFKECIYFSVKNF